MAGTISAGRIGHRMAAGVLGVALCCAAPATGFGSAVTPSEVSAPVRAAIEKELKGASIRRIDQQGEGAKATYEITARAQGKSVMLLVAGDGSVIKKFIDDEFAVYKGRLERDGAPYTIRTIQTPTAGDPARGTAHLMRSIYAISDVGGTTLVFDLYGFNKDGTRLSGESTAHVRNIMATVASHSMGGVCRVLGGDAPKGTAGRQNAVETAAEAFRDGGRLVYWIDGPEAESLARAFKQAAPDLIVVAPGADVEVAATVPEGPLARPTLVVGAMPKDLKPNLHFVLPGKPEDYEALERASIYPFEREPWTPDNSVLSEAERKEGFVALFDGKTLNGWTSIGRVKDSFVVKDGEMHWQKRGAGALQSRNRYGDFILRFEYKINNNGNSGVQVRTPRANRASKMGFEVQLFGDYGRQPTKNGTGAIYDVIAPTENASRPAGEWNTVEVTARGPRVKIVLNGRTVQDVNFDEHEALKYRLRRGFIRLTDHGDYVAYRNLRIKEL